MRTKTLVCAAAIAASAVTSVMAQGSNVYSLNIVGYANVAIPAGNDLFANPFKVSNVDGSVNRADHVLTCLAPLDPSGALPGLDTFFLSFWNGGGFNTAYYESDFCPGGGFGSTNGWATGTDGSIQVPIPTLTNGTGFFINNGSPATTNTFAGEVVPNPGSTNDVAIGVNNVLLGSACPFSGNQTGTQNIFQLPLAPLDPSGALPGLDTFFLSLWNPAIAKYSVVYYESDFCIGGGFGSTNGWATDASGSVQTNPPSIPIGHGFFLNNGSPAIIWHQTITNAP